MADVLGGQRAPLTEEDKEDSRKRFCREVTLILQGVGKWPEDVVANRTEACFRAVPSMIAGLQDEERGKFVKEHGSPASFAKLSLNTKRAYLREIASGLEQRNEKEAAPSGRRTLNQPAFLLAAICGVFTIEAVEEDWAIQLASWLLSLLGAFYAWRLLQEKRILVGVICLAGAIAHNQIRPLDLSSSDQPWLFGWTALFALALGLIQAGVIKGGPLPSIYR